MLEMAHYTTQVLKEQDYAVTDWSGGKTKQLVIAPRGSVYAKRSFLWRLSSATVDVEKSTFTALPDYYRYIMTLEGGFRLRHNGGEWKEFSEFEPWGFDGADDTESEGKVTDFNLMLRKGRCIGTMTPMILTKGEQIDADSLRTADVPDPDEILLYCWRGSFSFRAEDKNAHVIHIGETLRLSGNFRDAAFSCTAKDDVKIAAATVKYVLDKKAEEQVRKDSEDLFRRIQTGQSGMSF